MDELRQMRHTIEKFQAKEAAGETERILFGAHEVGGLKVLTAAIPEADPARLRQMGDQLRDRAADVVAVLPASRTGKSPSWPCAASRPSRRALRRGHRQAGLRHRRRLGGGKPESAMGGGKDPLMLDNALAMVDNFVSMKLKG